MLKYKWFIFFIILSGQTLFCQTDRGLTIDNDYTALYFLNPNRNNGYEVSLSAVAMFTLGASDRNGVRWGGGLTVAKNIGDFKISLGADVYKARQNFGLGTTFFGLGYDDGEYGISYYVNKYYQGDKQVSGIVNLNLRDFEIRFEDDILAIPFTDFIVYDRYRTAALELRYKHFLIGFNVYTNEANGLMDVSSKNRYGVYYTGQQISSPLYVGYTNKNLLVRYGVNSSLGGLWGQNGWHRLFFSTPDFHSLSLSNPFLQIGVDKPYTLY